MRVKIKGKVYDSERVPITLNLSADDKKVIGDMQPEVSEIHIYPSDQYWIYNKTR